MSTLKDAAMARVPLSPEEVEKHWRSHGLVIEVLCESHERLRMELEAAQLLLEYAKDKATGLERTLEEMRVDLAEANCKISMLVDDEE